jgi:hypothetical protein
MRSGESELLRECLQEDEQAHTQDAHALGARGLLVFDEARRPRQSVDVR